MKTQAEPDFSRICDKKTLQPLYRAIEDFISFRSDIKVDSERARERAFEVRSNSQLFKYWYVRSQVLNKFQEGSVSASDRKAAAIAKFLEAETVCATSNARLYDAFNRPSAQAWWPELKRAKNIISEILGKFQLDDLPYSCAFSSGASTEFNRSESDIQKKWGEATHVTAGALPYAVAFARWAGPLRNWRFTLVAGNKVFTVPKNYERDRTCAKEPSWNMFLQKGVGLMIRTKLRTRVGLLHPDAQVTHQRLAREASLTGHLATLDLKAASDTIGNAIVDLLMPREWSQVLFALRSPNGSLPNGNELSYEKISSMGNGFTFELETLLFYALCKACCGREEVVSVYGDDLIVPSAAAPRIVKLLRFCGFGLNPEKSFASGPFRESCGGHYFQGMDVKPFYIQRLPSSLGQVINLHNDIVTYHKNMPRNERLVRVAEACRRVVPRSFWGPIETDGSLWSEWDEARPSFSGKTGKSVPRLISGWKGDVKIARPIYQHWRVRTVRRKVVRQSHDYYYGALLAALWPVGQGMDAVRRKTLQEFALDTASSEVRMSEFMYVQTSEQFGWQAVGVGIQWNRLPIRLKAY
jgi:hypothetical protein